MKKIVLLSQILLAGVLMGQNAAKVKDVTPFYLGTTNFDMAGVNNTLYLGIYDTINGRELWKSDGTLAGTQLVKNITADFYVMGSGTLGPGPKNTTAYNGKVCFSQPSLYSGSDELYVSDGTSGGTQKVITSGTPPTLLSDFKVAGNYLYFTSNSSLWRTDGTNGGSIDLGSAANIGFPSTLTSHDGNLYFKAYDNNYQYGSELWKTDGTPSGTVLVKDIEPGSAGSYIGKIVSSGNKLYFNNFSSGYGYELWISDGTSAGTSMLLDLIPGSAGSNPVNMTDVNGSLFFGAVDSIGVAALWKTDGTVIGTVKVKDSLDLSMSTYSKQTVNANGKLFFAAYGPGVTGSSGLWVSDGTANGTNLLLANSQAASMVSVNGIMYAIEIGGVNGILRSDGTVIGTYYIDNTKGFTGTAPTDLTVVGNNLFFASTLAGKYALWKIDGVTGVLERVIIDDDLISAYPNPASSMITIRSKENALVNVFSVDGKLVSSFRINAGGLYDLNNLTKGLYVVTATTPATISRKRIVIE